MHQLRTYTEDLDARALFGTECVVKAYSEVTSVIDEPEKSMVDRVKSLHVALTQLLRHFWRCFPGEEQATQEKLQRCVLHVVKARGAFVDAQNGRGDR